MGLTETSWLKRCINSHITSNSILWQDLLSETEISVESAFGPSLAAKLYQWTIVKLAISQDWLPCTHVVSSMHLNFLLCLDPPDSIWSTAAYSKPLATLIDNLGCLRPVASNSLLVDSWGSVWQGNVAKRKKEPSRLKLHSVCCEFISDEGGIRSQINMFKRACARVIGEHFCDSSWFRHYSNSGALTAAAGACEISQDGRW